MAKKLSEEEVIIELWSRYELCEECKSPILPGFCMECGNPIFIEFCGECGSSKMPEFCGKCGARI